jgi:hypothetical protein
MVAAGMVASMQAGRQAGAAALGLGLMVVSWLLVPGITEANGIQSCLYHAE